MKDATTTEVLVPYTCDECGGGGYTPLPAALHATLVQLGIQKEYSVQLGIQRDARLDALADRAQKAAYALSRHREIIMRSQSPSQYSVLVALDEAIEMLCGEVPRG